MVAMATILDFRFERFWLFLIYKSPWCFLPSFESIGFSGQEKKQKKKIFKMAADGHLGFQIRMILASFDLQVSLILPTRFPVNLPFGQEMKRKKDFQDGCNFSYF